MARKNGNQDFDPNDMEALAPIAGKELATFDPSQFTVDVDAFADLIRSGKGALEQVVVLQPGKGLKGKLLGYGGDVEYNDPEGKTEKNPSGKRAGKSYRLQVAPNVVAKILGCAQLDSDLPPHFGKNVMVVRGPKIQVGSRMVNRYFVSEILD